MNTFYTYPELTPRAANTHHAADLFNRVLTLVIKP